MNYKIIDPAVGILSGVIIASTVVKIIPPEIHMILGMLGGGLVGMSFKLLLTLILAPFFGAFEVMIPLILTGMAVGMLAGMAAAQEAHPEIIIAGGGAVGLGIALAVMRSNKNLTQGG